jgi:hypothetical protein
LPRANEYEDVKPLAEELIDTLLDLLFYADFTIPKLPTAKGKISYSIWQSGVGCNTSMGSSKELESNRCEILRLLLTVTGKAMYMPLSKFLFFDIWDAKLTTVEVSYLFRVLRPLPTLRPALTSKLSSHCYVRC